MKVCLLALAALLACATPAAQADATRVLDAFETTGAWTTVVSDDVHAHLRPAAGTQGQAMCLDYDFNGVSGYAVARRAMPMRYPGNYEFSIDVRGHGPANNLEFKLPDASGENVWWSTRPNYVASPDWTTLKFKKRHISFAWGPTPDPQLRMSAALELTVSAGKGGGKGSLCFDNLRFRELPAENIVPPAPRAVASAQMPKRRDGGSADGLARDAVDGDARSAWRSPAGIQSLALDLGTEREFGGLTLHWASGLHASDYQVQASTDGKRWTSLRQVHGGNGGNDSLALPESEARWLRLLLERGPGTSYALQELIIEPLAFAATPNDFIHNLAAKTPRGRYPRGFSGEQPYWTLLGIDGGNDTALISEDGAIEAGKGGFSIEPFLVEDGHVLGWADMQIQQSLQDGYLPVPSVHWTRSDGMRLDITGFAMPDGGDTAAGKVQVLARYVVRNEDAAPRHLQLALALRPFQVNPPSQFLNTVGGFSPIRQLRIEGSSASIDGIERVRALQAPQRVFATSFDSGGVEDVLGSETMTDTTQVTDETGLASGAMLFDMALAPGESREVDVLMPLRGASFIAPADVDAAQAQVAAAWRGKLNRVRLQVPEAGQVVADQLRSALAQMLVSRVGPRLQPGTRSYARAWIRDGAMISEALLRLGHAPVTEAFLRWYAPHQFASGKIPCCVDDRGSDPVAENDSQGEFIHVVAELYRYAGDRALLEQMWPRVNAAVRTMEEMRLSERNEGQRVAHPELYGLMPASISHEGYSAKPMHSYWDDFWSLRGYKDAVAIARALGRDADTQRIARSRDQFSADLDASIVAATHLHHIDYLPGAAELGDFDATSTTIALAPGGDEDKLPPALLHETFDRYWRQLQARRNGSAAWDAYTPYELRNVGVFVRLGWRERAWQALQYFLADRQPVAWNQWAEVVLHAPRKPQFLGDLPHAWVASDYARSALDLFAFERESDQSLVIAAGVPSGWFEGDGIAVSGLRTAHGLLAYSAHHRGNRLELHLEIAGLHDLAGGVVLPWPLDGQPGKTWVNGKPVAWSQGELRVNVFPADICIESARR